MQGPFPAHLQSQGKAPWGRGWKKLESVWTVSILSKDATAKLTTTFLSYVRQTTFMSSHVAFWCRYADDHDSY